VADLAYRFQPFIPIRGGLIEVIMSVISVDEIQSRIAALADQDPVTSDISSTDYALRLKFINMAMTEWQEAYDWQVLYNEYSVLVSTSTGNASIALPLDFRKIASFPLIVWDGSTTDRFPEVRPQEKSQFSLTNRGGNTGGISSPDRWVEVWGNPRANYTMFIHAPTLASGASVLVPYYRSFQSLASPADICEIPNPMYVIKRSLAYLWEVRQDDRFPEMKSESERILGQMIDYENTFSEASTYDRVKTIEQTRFGDFRWGDSTDGQPWIA